MHITCKRCIENRKEYVPLYKLKRKNNEKLLYNKRCITTALVLILSSLQSWDVYTVYCHARQNIYDTGQLRVKDFFKGPPHSMRRTLYPVYRSTTLTNWPACHITGVIIIECGVLRRERKMNDGFRNDYGNSVLVLGSSKHLDGWQSKIKVINNGVKSTGVDPSAASTRQGSTMSNRYIHLIRGSLWTSHWLLSSFGGNKVSDCPFFQHNHLIALELFRNDCTERKVSPYLN